MECDDTTPSKPKNNHLRNKILSNQLNCDSPLNLLPRVSTPPSRFTKIFNPFESHLIERLHLPTFSPSVFAQVSTPKAETKFKWSIDEVSSLRPADIDEATLSQHVNEDDPCVESIVQEKIDRFFNDKVIVPSPMTQQVNSMAPVLFKTPPSLEKQPKQFRTNSSQTILTLPPVLPAHLEEILKPFCTFTQDQQQADDADANSSLYRQLFLEGSFHDDDDDEVANASHESSPAPPSVEFSPIDFSPKFGNHCNDFGTPCGVPLENGLLLSPIARSTKESKSACRLSFSAHMSVDASLIVPDMNKSLNFSNLEENTSSSDDSNVAEQVLNNSVVNWNMEYSNVFLSEQTPSSRSTPVLSHSASGSDTPHSKLFTSQRKRLSDSFKDVDFEKDIEMEMEEHIEQSIKRSKNRGVSCSDTGYHTGDATCENFTFDDRVHWFASTPTKN